jgi:hypothetical protein
MAGARQTSGQEAMVNILRKLESMLDQTNKTYEETLLILSSTESVMKNDISVELKKQSAILSSLESSSNIKLERLIAFSNLSYEKQLSILSSSESMKAELALELGKQTATLNSISNIESSSLDKLERLILISNLSNERQLAVLGSIEAMKEQMSIDAINQSKNFKSLESSILNSSGIANTAIIDELRKQTDAFLSSIEAMKNQVSSSIENQTATLNSISNIESSSLDKLERLISLSNLSYERQLVILSSIEAMKEQMSIDIRNQSKNLNTLESSILNSSSISNIAIVDELRKQTDAFLSSIEAMKNQVSSSIENQTTSLNSIADVGSSSVNRLESIIAISNLSYERQLVILSSIEAMKNQFSTDITNQSISLKSLESSILNSSGISNTAIVDELRKQTDSFLSSIEAMKNQFSTDITNQSISLKSLESSILNSSNVANATIVNESKRQTLALTSLESSILNSNNTVRDSIVQELKKQGLSIVSLETSILNSNKLIKGEFSNELKNSIENFMKIESQILTKLELVSSLIEKSYKDILLAFLGSVESMRNEMIIESKNQNSILSSINLKFDLINQSYEKQISSLNLSEAVLNAIFGELKNQSLILNSFNSNLNLTNQLQKEVILSITDLNGIVKTGIISELNNFSKSLTFSQGYLSKSIESIKNQISIDLKTQTEVLTSLKTVIELSNQSYTQIIDILNSNEAAKKQSLIDLKNQIEVLTSLRMMIESSNKVYENQLSVLRSSESILKNEISIDLKKKIKILSSLDDKMNLTNQLYEQYLTVAKSSEILTKDISLNLSKQLIIFGSLESSILSSIEAMKNEISNKILDQSKILTSLNLIVESSNRIYEQELVRLNSIESSSKESLIDLKNQNIILSSIGDKLDIANNSYEKQIAFFRKLENTLESSNQSFRGSLITIFKSSENIKNDISVDLKKQISALTAIISIESSILGILESIKNDNSIDLRKISLLNSIETSVINLVEVLKIDISNELRKYNSTLSSIESSIIKKLETRDNSFNQKYQEDILISLRSIESIIKSDISLDIKKQITNLSSLESLISSTSEITNQLYNKQINVFEKLENMIELSSQSYNTSVLTIAGFLESMKNLILIELKNQSNVISSLEKSISVSDQLYREALFAFTNYTESIKSVFSTELKAQTEILANLSSKFDIGNQSYKESLLAFTGSIESVKTEISSELKNQTSILTSLESKIGISNQSLDQQLISIRSIDSVMKKEISVDLKKKIAILTSLENMFGISNVSFENQLSVLRSIESISKNEILIDIKNQNLILTSIKMMIDTANQLYKEAILTIPGLSESMKNEVSSALKSQNFILSSLDNKATFTNELYEQALIAINSIDSTFKNEISSELKNQSEILISLTSKLDPKNQSSDQSIKTFNLVESMKSEFSVELKTQTEILSSIVSSELSILSNIESMIILSNRSYEQQSIILSLIKVIKEDVSLNLKRQADILTLVTTIESSILKKLENMFDLSERSYKKTILILNSFESMMQRIYDELKNQTKILSLITSLESSAISKLIGIFDISNRTYEQQSEVLNSNEKMKYGISDELKKQTNVLTSIESKLDGISKGGVNSVKDSGLSSAIGGIPQALKELVKMLGLAAILGPFIEMGAEYLANSIKILLESAKGIDPAIALTSVGFFSLITASKLSELVTVLSKSLGIRGLLGLGLGGTAKNLASAVRTLLSILEPQPGGIFGIGADPRRISMESALGSVFAINLLSGSKITELFAVLGKGVGLFAMVGNLIRGNSERALANSIRELLMIAVYSEDQEKRGLGKTGNVIDKEIIIGSVFAIAILSTAKIKELAQALRPAFGGIFGSGAGGMEKRSAGIANAVRSFLTVSQGIDKEVMISSVLAMGIISYSVDILISALRRAAIFNPFILLGLKVTKKAISTLLESVNSVQKDGKDMLGAAAYLVALSFSIGTLLTATVVAAFLSPLVIIGSLALKFMISSVVSIKNTMDKNQVNETFIEKISKLIVATSAIIGVAILIANFSTQNSIPTIIGNIVMLGVMSFLLIKMTSVVANQMSTAEGKIKKLDLLTIAATNLLNAITLIILSKAMQNPTGSIGNLIMFGVMQLILVGSIYFVIKAISNAKGTSSRSILSYNILILGMVLTTMLAILFVRSVGTAALGDIILFSLMIATISFTAIFFSKRLANSYSNIVKGVGALAIWTLGILVVGLGILAFAALVPPLAVLYTVLAISTIALMAYVIGSNNNVINKGSYSIVGIALSLIVFSIALIVFKMAKMELIDSLILGTAVGGLALVMFLAGKRSTEIEKGSIAMIVAGITLIIISAALIIFKASKFGWDDAGVLGAVVVGLGVAMAIAGAGPVPGFIIAGSGAMIVASIAVIVLSVGLLIFKKSNFIMDDALTLGATIGILGVEMGLFGLASPFIIAGSAAMLVAGIALLPLTLGLTAFKASGFTKDDGQNLQAALGSVINGFLGGEMPGGLAASLKFAAQAAARSALLLITVPPMILAGTALMLIIPALSAFKKAGFTQSDADSIEYMVGSVVRAFGIVTDTDRQKAMGFNVNPSDLFFGIMSLSGAGRVLSGLAQGIQSWANLEVTEWEVINPGTKDAKLVIKGKRKLNKTDFENAAFGIASVINALSEPFAKVGRLEKGQPSGDPIYDAIFGGGFVSAGIDALSRSGNTLVNLAKGVQAWANLEITEYEVIGAGTKNARIVPKSVRKMNTMDFAMASTNIGMVIGFLANEFAKIGRMEMNTEGIFSGGVVKKGIESIAGLGDNLLSIAEVITKMANLEIVENEVKIIDGKPQLVPKSVRKITPAEMALAGKNIGEITGFLAREIAKIGQMEANSEGFFADGYVAKGKEAIAGLGQNISSMADAIIKMANTEITEYKINEKGELVPVATRKMGDSDFVKASENISRILGIIVNSVVEFGKNVESNESAIQKANSALPNMTNALAEAAKPIEAWSKLKDTDKIGSSMVSFLDTIKMVFDPEKSKSISDTDKYFTSFTSNIEKIASPENTLDKVATNVDRIQKSMKLLKETINQMDLKKLTLTDSLMKSIAMLSKNPEAIANAIEGSIEKSFEDLVNALKEIINEANNQAQVQAQAAAAAAASVSTSSAAPAAPGTPAPAQSTQAPTNAGNMATQLAAALAAITMNVKVTNTTPIKTTG